jgi:Rieske Fe-S protein
MPRPFLANTAASVPPEPGHPPLVASSQQALHAVATGPAEVLDRCSTRAPSPGGHSCVGLLSLEFVGASVAFLWPTAGEGLGIEHEVGTLDQIGAAFPAWASGEPIEFRPARAFLVNVPAAKAWALGEDPSAHPPKAGDILALWRKCPHLGCMIPKACESRGRFQCYCHQSTYNILGEKLELGPAPRGMDRFPVRINNGGFVIVDTREVIEGPPKGTLSFTDLHPPDVGCR